MVSMPLRSMEGPRTWPAAVRDYALLTKPRIVVLLLITGLCSMVVASAGLPPLRQIVWMLLGLALACGGANAVNMWYDRDIDPVMQRTQTRPLPSGRLQPIAALRFGIVSEIASLIVLGLAINWLTALLAFAGFLYYVFIYTMWLKRRTPQNIVIGGGSGAFPPLVGWAAVTGSIGWPAIVMFLIIFFWTPPHFWALALYKQGDYHRAGVPMMPVARGERATKRQICVYTALLLLVSVLLYQTHVVDILYLVVALALGIGFVLIVLRLLRERAPETMWAKRTFRYSLLYLTVIFAVMVIGIHH